MRALTLLRPRLLAVVALGALPVALVASQVGPLVTFTTGGVADANEVNANFDALRTAVDDNDARLGVLEGGGGATGLGAAEAGLLALAVAEASPGTSPEQSASMVADPIDYAFPASAVDVSASAVFVNSEGSTQSATLAALRDGNIGTYGAYFAGAGGSLGYLWGTQQNLTRLRFYNFNTNARVAGFRVEAYDGTSWTKVSITAWTEGCFQSNGDEATALNAEGWVTVGFAPLSGKSGIRLAATSVYNNGNANAGVAELQALVDAGMIGLASLSGGTASGGFLSSMATTNDVTSAGSLHTAGTASSFTLAAIQDNSFSTYAGYFGGPGGAAGLTFASDRDLRRLRFYNFNTNARIANFRIDAFDGSTWAKVPITAWVEGCVPNATDEASATNAQGWVTVEFGPLAAKRGVRIWVNSVHNNGNANAGIAELRVYTASAVGDFSAVSIAYPAVTSPAAAALVAEYENVAGNAVLNTDLAFEVSRDGGTSWTAVPVSDLGPARRAGVRALFGLADLTGQPSGTSMKWRATSANAKEQRVHGVFLKWGVAP